VFPGKEPHVLRIEVVRNVVPLDEHGAVEPIGICRTADDDACFVRMILV
jgi:hypothetical protein